jgi:23S rRNA pseudouridine2605 synthase
MRLQKFLAHAGVCSRRKAEEHILNRLVRVNGQVVNTLGTQVDPQKDEIFFKQQKIVLSARPSSIYIALNKPVGVVSSCSDKRSKIVLNLVDIPERIYPVGRLDKDSNGLILLTNDGDLHNQLTHPSFNHEKEYEVVTKKPLSNADLKQFKQGMVIDGVKTRKANVTRLGIKKFRITLKQGLNRQIRKMVQLTDNTVVHLKRIRMGSIHLGDLKTGQWRHLSDQEVAGLKE